jgi:hypothetical protein
MDALLATPLHEMSVKKMEYKMSLLDRKKAKEQADSKERLVRLQLQHEERKLQFQLQLAQLNALRTPPTTSQVGMDNAQHQHQGNAYGTGVTDAQGSVYGGSAWDVPHGLGLSGTDTLANQQEPGLWPELPRSSRAL